MLLIPDRRKILTYLLVLIFLLTSFYYQSFLFASDLRRSSISGFVFDTANGESLIGANVFISGMNYGAATNTNGYYVITDVPSGKHVLICSYMGFKDFRKDIQIREGQQLVVNIALESQPLQAETIEVIAESLRTAELLYKKPISRLSITPMEIRQMPAIAEADLLRTLQNLPGILPISDYSSELYVRGGRADQNLYLMDGADVYNPEHAFGMFSTFNTDAIKHVEISKGGFGAAYGGRMSSILNVTNLDGNRHKFEGTAEISLLSAKATLQMPIKKTGSISASIRRTYFDQTVGRFIDDVPDYYFYDGHLKAFFDLNPNNKLTISSFFGKDILNYDFAAQASNSEKLHYDWGNMTGSLRWTHIFNPQFFANMWLTVSAFNSKFELTEITEKNELTDWSVKGQFEYAFSQKIDAQFGFEYKNLSTLLEQDSPGGIIDVQRQRSHTVGYFLVEWKPLAGWQIEPGVRYNFFSSDRTFEDWEPRLSSKYRLTETISLKAATGRYYQYLNRIPRPFLADIWTSANSYYGSSYSDHYIIGLLKEVAGNLEFEVESYYKTYRNIYSLKNHFMDLQPEGFDARGRPVYKGSKGLFDVGRGNSKGVELLLRKKYGSYSGWLAYTLARTEYTMDGVNQNRAFVPRHDRTSVINIVLNTEIKNAIRELRDLAYKSENSRWLFGLNFVYSSGQPITLTSSTYLMSSFPDREYDQILLYPTKINNFRLPPYVRLDVSLTYERQFKDILASSYIQIFNVGNRENVWFIRYTNLQQKDKIEQEVTTFNMLPILPSVGIRIKF